MRVLTLGTFDLFHTGHVNLLRRCRWMAGESGTVLVGLNTDSFVERYKGAPPVIAYADRYRVLMACRYVDGVVPNEQPDGSIRDVIGATEPDVIVVGSDWQDRDYHAQIGMTADELAARGIRVAYAPYTPDISTSAIKAALR